ncbi:peroxidase 27-like [Impatiens glandulifera]|uniref:peroxidase 27-like n=1 Tax=Impatiens glandulifera TaxID=253017 RepID=UPI001FB0FD69|nr:peroxidase 27-like [Impatiens glandulifera]
MENAKSVGTPLEAHFKLSSKYSPSNDDEKECMKNVPYSSVFGSLMYAMSFCVRSVSQRISQTMIISVMFKLFVFLALVGIANSQGLKLDFYKQTCPSLDAIVRETTARFVLRAPTLAAPLLRMHFHDCFVRGCDGSVLLNSTKSNQSEKEAIPNQTLRGWHVIDAVKTAIEKKCPGVVSCADILALIARDSTLLINGPFWEVPLGRRDGSVSISNEALNGLPSPFANITTLKSQFSVLGLDAKDLAVLSGAHTIGIGHCFAFNNRLYNFTGKGDTDPTMDPNYIARLKTRCKPGDSTTFVEMDPGSFKTFDEDYYTMVSKRRGLFQSDAALLADQETKAYVKLQALSHGSTFFKDFGVSMIKMGNVGVLTGNAGEIRKQCALVN